MLRSRRLAVLLPLLFVTASVHAQEKTPQEKTPKELLPLQGQWKIVKMSVPGFDQPVPPGGPEQIRVVGTSLDFLRNGQPMPGFSGMTLQIPPGEHGPGAVIMNNPQRGMLPCRFRFQKKTLELAIPMPQAQGDPNPMPLKAPDFANPKAAPFILISAEKINAEKTNPGKTGAE